MARVADGGDILVFALTPRAGSRHHVYLLPASGPTVQRRVNELAPKVTQAVNSARDPVVTGPEFVVAWQSATQRTTGRVGREWLCVASWSPGGFQFMPARAAEDWLRARLGELDELVAHRQWADASSLYETLPELEQWQREARQRLEEFGRPLDASDLAIRGPMHRPAALSRRARRLLVAACLVAVLGYIGVAADCFSRIKERLSKIATWPPTLAPPIDWKPLAKAVGAEPVPEEIRRKLQELFEADVSWRDAAETIINSILQDFEKEMGRKPADGLKSLLGSRKLMDELASLYDPAGKFFPAGLLQDGEARDFWDLSPRQVCELQESFRKTALDLNNSFRVDDETRGYLGGQYQHYYNLFELLGEFVIDYKLPELRRRFFLPGDVEDLQLRNFKWLIEELSNECRKAAGSQSDGQAPKTAKECVKAVVSSYGMNGSMRPAAAETAKYLKEKSQDKRKVAFSRRLEGFLKLVGKWEEIIQDQARTGAATGAH